jgi:hypothetical protein
VVQAMQQRRRRRAFTPAFKAEVVELCRQGDRTIPEVARVCGQETRRRVRRYERIQPARIALVDRSLWRLRCRVVVRRTGRWFPGLSSEVCTTSTNEPDPSRLLPPTASGLVTWANLRNSPWTAIAAVSAGNWSFRDGGNRCHPRATLLIVYWPVGLGDGELTRSSQFETLVSAPKLLGPDWKPENELRQLPRCRPGTEPDPPTLGMAGMLRSGCRPPPTLRRDGWSRRRRATSRSRTESSSSSGSASAMRSRGVPRTDGRQPCGHMRSTPHGARSPARSRLLSRSRPS